MAQSFNITAKLNIQAPTNLNQVRSSIASNLKSIPVNLSFQVPKNLSSKLNQLNRAIPTFSNNLDKMSASAKGAVAAINQLNSAFQKFQAQSTNFGGAAKQFSSISRSVAQASKETKTFGEQAGIALRRFSAFAVGASALVGTVQSLKTAIKEAGDFQNELVRLSQVTSRPLVGLKGISDQVTELSTTFGVSSKDIIKAATTLAQAGFRAEELRKSLDTLAKTTLAPTFDTIEKTTEGLIATFNQFGLKADEIASSFDAINAVSARYAVESSDIIEAVKRAGGAFVQTGGNLNEFLALFTAVRDTTRQSAETIATGFNTIFTRLQRPQTIKFLQQIGVEVVDLEGKFVGPYKAVEALNQALASLQPGDVRFAQIAEQLGGYRQIPRLIPLIREFALAQEALGVATSGQGSLNRDAIKSQESLARQFQKVQEQFLALARSFGENQQIKQTLRLILDLASASIKLTDALKPLIPLVGLIGIIRGGAFISSTLKGIRSGKTFARGGIVPGSGDSDSVPAMLMPGEFVLRKRAVQSIGVDKLEGYNQGNIQRRASGGSAYLSGFSTSESKLLNNYLAFFARKTGYKPNELAKSINKSNIHGYAGLFTPGPNIDFFSPGRIDIGKTKDLKGTLFHELAHGLDYKLGNQMPSAFTNQASLDFVGRFSEGLEKVNIGKYISKPAYNYITQVEELFAEGIAQTLNPSSLYGTNAKLPQKTLLEMSKIAKSGIFRKRASGGNVDSVPALLTPGEFVINKDAAQSIGLYNLHKLNNADKIQKFNSGGPVRFANGGLSSGTPSQRRAVKIRRVGKQVGNAIGSYGSIAGLAIQSIAGQPYEPVVGETEASFQKNSFASSASTALSAGLIAASFTPFGGVLKLATLGLTTFVGYLSTSSNQLKEFKINQLNEEVNQFVDTLQRYSGNLSDILDNPNATPEEIRKTINQNKDTSFLNLNSIFQRTLTNAETPSFFEGITRFIDKGIGTNLGPSDTELAKRGTSAVQSIAADASGSLQEQANKILRAEIQTGTNIKTPEQVKSVLGGLFNQLVEAESARSQKPKDVVEKQLSEELSRRVRPAAAAAELERLTIAANKSSSLLQEFASSVSDFGNNIEANSIKFGQSLSELDARLSGGFARDTSLDGLSLLGKSGSVSGEVFGKSLEESVKKGLITPELATFGRDVSQVSQNLPTILKSFLGTNKVDDLNNIETIKGIVGQLKITTPQLAKSLEDSLQTTALSLNSGASRNGSSELEKAVRNPDQIIQQVLDASISSIQGVFDKVAQEYQKIQERQIKIEEKRLQSEQEIISQLTQSSNIAFERDRLSARFAGRSEFSAGDNRQSDLFNNLGATGFSVDDLKNRLIELNNTPKSGLSIQEQSSIISETGRLTQALQSLTNVSELTSNSFEKLERATEKQRAKGDVARSIFKGGQALTDTLRDAGIISQVKSAGSLNGASFPFIDKFLEALDGPFGKILPPEFLKQIADNTGGPTGELLKLIASSSDEEKKIQQEIISTYNRGIEANNALIEVTQSNVQSIDDLNSNLLTNSNQALIDSQSTLTTAMQNLTKAFQDAYPTRKSDGGLIYAAKGFTPRGTDTVPAMMGNKPFMLTPGEFVINSRSSRKYRPILEALNNDTMYAAKGFDLSEFDDSQQKIINNVLNRIKQVLTIKDDNKNIIKDFNIEEFVKNIKPSNELNKPFGVSKAPFLGLAQPLKSGKSNIFINPGIDNKDLSYVLSHEIGHSIYRKLDLSNSGKLITEIIPDLEKQRTSLIDKNLIRANKPEYMVKLANTASEKFYNEAFADNFSASIFADTDTKSFPNKYGGVARPTSLSKLQRASLAEIPQLIKQTILSGNINTIKKSDTSKLTPNQIAEIEESKKIQEMLTGKNIETPINTPKRVVDTSLLEQERVGVGDTSGARSGKINMAARRAARAGQVQQATDTITRTTKDAELAKNISQKFGAPTTSSLADALGFKSPSAPNLPFGPNPGSSNTLPTLPSGDLMDLSGIQPTNKPFPTFSPSGQIGDFPIRTAPELSFGPKPPISGSSSVLPTIASGGPMDLSNIRPISNPIQEQIKQSTTYKLKRPDRNFGPYKQDYKFGQYLDAKNTKPYNLVGNSIDDFVSSPNFNTLNTNSKPTTQKPSYRLEKLPTPNSIVTSPEFKTDLKLPPIDLPNSPVENLPESLRSSIETVPIEEQLKSVEIAREKARSGVNTQSSRAKPVKGGYGNQQNQNIIKNAIIKNALKAGSNKPKSLFRGVVTGAQNLVSSALGKPKNILQLARGAFNLAAIPETVAGYAGDYVGTKLDEAGLNPFDSVFKATGIDKQITNIYDNQVIRDSVNNAIGKPEDSILNNKNQSAGLSDDTKFYLSLPQENTTEGIAKRKRMVDEYESNKERKQIPVPDISTLSNIGRPTRDAKPNIPKDVQNILKQNRAVLNSPLAKEMDAYNNRPSPVIDRSRPLNRMADYVNPYASGIESNEQVEDRIRQERETQQKNADVVKAQNAQFKANSPRAIFNGKEYKINNRFPGEPANGLPRRSDFEVETKLSGNRRASLDKRRAERATREALQNSRRGLRDSRNTNEIKSQSVEEQVKKDIKEKTSSGNVDGLVNKIDNLMKNLDKLNGIEINVKVQDVKVDLTGADAINKMTDAMKVVVGNAIIEHISKAIEKPIQKLT